LLEILVVAMKNGEWWTTVDRVTAVLPVASLKKMHVWYKKRCSSQATNETEAAINRRMDIIENCHLKVTTNQSTSPRSPVIG
jgi:hypothetical protein